MLQNNITNFLYYCKNSNFSERSVESLTFMLNEFSRFIKSQHINSIDKINYQHLLRFVADYGAPSPSVKKARVWSLHQFFHYLKLQQVIDDNIALKLPYPKIEKKVTQFLTEDEFKSIPKYFGQQATDIQGLRNLVMIMMMGFLGLRTAAIVAININDVDLTESKLWIHEKGYRRHVKKVIPLPQILCQILSEYIKQLDTNQAPLFMSKRNKRYAPRSLQNLFKNVADQLCIEKKLHTRLFRHSFASHLNDEEVDILMIQDLLGHATPRTTADYYIHPSEKKVREALEKLPGVIYINQLIQSGYLKFQSSYFKRE